MKKLNQILLSPDGVDSATEVDPLSDAAGGVNTDFPVLTPDRICTFKVERAAKETSDKGEGIRIKLRLEKDATFRDGKPARAGFSANTLIWLTPSDRYDIEAVKRSAAKWIKSCLGKTRAATTTVRQFVNNPEMIEGSLVQCSVGIKADKTGQYGDQNTFNPVIPE